MYFDVESLKMKASNVIQRLLGEVVLQGVLVKKDRSRQNT